MYVNIYMDGTMGYNNLRWFPGFPGSPIPIVGEGSLPHHLHITTLCGEMPWGSKKDVSDKHQHQQQLLQQGDEEKAYSIL